MAKSKAQRMKEYRERKKNELGDEWLKRENQRVKAYFIPVDDLEKENQDKRRAKNKLEAMRYRQKKKQNENEISAVDSEISLPSTSSECAVSSTTDDISLTVKMAFKKPERKAGGKKRVSRALKRSYTRIETLEDKNEELQRKLNTARKRLSRTLTKHRTPLTPKSKTDSIMTKAGLDPKQAPEIRKRLLYSECLSEEIRVAKSHNTINQNVIQRIVSGKIVKKYRMKSTLQKCTNLNRRKDILNKNIPTRRRRLYQQRDKLVNDVTEFLERDDNSRLLPGKADAVKVRKGKNKKKQKRVLNDYMHTLHMKFKPESSFQISYATFCRLRPRHISLVNFASRSVCLCSKHQNFAFKLKAMKNLKVLTCTSPDTFVDLFKNTPNQLNETLQRIPSEIVKYQEWKRVKLPNGKEQMRIVDLELSKADFIEAMKKSFNDFVGHVERVKAQYSSVKIMKENLPQNHAIVQMDFSENFNCQAMEEIQSAFWNASMVTLHPTVIYFKSEDGKLEHKSIVYVSEVMNHNAAMVLAIVEKIVNSVKQHVPNLEYIHFWTDSPSSQYRNKTIFGEISDFHNKYDVRASWHYFECGHGKGPCDGVGGTTKRNADNAIKQGKAVIQDASDFFAWAVQNEGDTLIEYNLITPDEYENSKKKDESKQLKPLKGTMTLHAVVGIAQGHVMIRNTTCVCETCFGITGFNEKSTCGWEKRTVHITSCESKVITETEMEVENQQPEKATGTSHVSIDDFVVALYEGRCYIGQVIELDNTDNTVHVNFMVQSGKIKHHYRWPSNEDKVWIQGEDILRVIEKPGATGKTRRIYAVPQEVTTFMDNYHE